MSLGDRLRELREQRGLSGRAAATYLGISNAHVSDLENERAGPSLELLVRLALYYRTTTDYLLGLDPGRDAGLLDGLDPEADGQLRVLIAQLRRMTPTERRQYLNAVLTIVRLHEPHVVGDDESASAASETR